MINVSSWSIKNPIPGVLLFIMLTAIGAMSFRAMKIQNFPDIDLPTVTVTASLPGASPSQLETDVARKIENQIATLQGVKHIYTSVQDGVSTTTVEFRLEKPTQEAVDDVRDAVSRVRSDLPAELRDPIISKFDLAGAPILTYTVASSRMDDEALSWFVDDTVTRSLLAVRGVGAVTRVGGATREVRVELDPARLLALNATAADISRQLRQTQRESSGGRTDVGGAEQSVRTIATVQSAAVRRRWRSRSQATAGTSLNQVARVSVHPSSEQRSAVVLKKASRSSGFEFVATRERRRGRGRERRPRRAGGASRRATRHHDHRAFKLRRSGRGELLGSIGDWPRGRRACRAGRGPVPARPGSRDAGRVDGVARSRSSRRIWAMSTASAYTLNGP
jgi:multidrug efflux pump subunit AcrB